MMYRGFSRWAPVIHFDKTGWCGTFKSRDYDHLSLLIAVKEYIENVEVMENVGS